MPYRTHIHSRHVRTRQNRKSTSQMHNFGKRIASKGWSVGLGCEAWLEEQSLHRTPLSAAGSTVNGPPDGAPSVCASHITQCGFLQGSVCHLDSPGKVHHSLTLFVWSTRGVPGPKQQLLYLYSQGVCRQGAWQSFSIVWWRASARGQATEGLEQGMMCTRERTVTSTAPSARTLVALLCSLVALLFILVT